MTSVNRAALLTKTHKVLKKHFKPFPPDLKRPLLEQLLYACCLENSNPEQADQAYLVLSERFFDLNEVRVSSVRELSEVLHMLADSTQAGSRVKGLLQSVFESVYAFDLEPLKKQNIGVAIKRLEKYEGVTPFGLAYATQTALGGHAIPVSKGAMECLVVVGVVTPEEAAEHRVPGLERAIPKNKGLEFGSLLHQLGVMYYASPYSPNLKKLLLEIDSNCKDRLPKRQVKKAEPVVETPPEPVVEPAPAKGKKGAKEAAAKTEPAPAPPAKQPEDPKKPSGKKPVAKPAEVKKPEEKKPEPKPAAAKKPEPVKPVAKKKPAAAKKPVAKKSSAQKITKKKPR
jgi:hypothetical protein